MSTHNGAAYLAAQLDSILSQDFTGFRVLIRDDGSSDETVSIVEKYAAVDDRIAILRSGGENLGASASFMNLVSGSDADHLMFADQDDVWLPGKISKTREKMLSLEEGSGENTPLAVFTDLEVVDANLKIVNPSFWNYQRLDPDISRDWKSLLAQNVVTGCTMMMNRAAKTVVLPYALPEMMHDHWCAARIAKFGRVHYLSEPTVLYRQHSANVEGAKNFGPFYAFSKMPGLFRHYDFYRRAAEVFGDTSAAELFGRKMQKNLKRF